jgi:hypothetical protein
MAGPDAAAIRADMQWRANARVSGAAAPPRPAASGGYDAASIRADMQRRARERAVAATAVEHGAATKVQAVQRGRSARVQLQAQNQAATKVQAAQRGRSTRQALSLSDRTATAPTAPRSAGGGYDAASIRADMQRRARERAVAATAQEHGAATKVQAVQRGRSARQALVVRSVPAPEPQPQPQPQPQPEPHM